LCLGGSDCMASLSRTYSASQAHPGRPDGPRLRNCSAVCGRHLQNSHANSNVLSPPLLYTFGSADLARNYPGSPVQLLDLWPAHACCSGGVVSSVSALCYRVWLGRNYYLSCCRLSLARGGVSRDPISPHLPVAHDSGLRTFWIGFCTVLPKP